MDDTALIDALQPLFDRWTDYFAVNDFVGLRSLWVEGLERPFYVAEEHGVLMSTWEEVDHYWAETAKINTDFKGRITLKTAKRTGDKHAMAQFKLAWKMSLVGWERPVGGTNRGMAGFEKTSDGWRIHSYIEAPMAPITYLRQAGASDTTMAEIKSLYMDVASTLQFPAKEGQ